MSRWEKVKQFLFGSVILRETVTVEKVIVKNISQWRSFKNDTPPVSNDEILVKNDKGVVLVVRYLSGDCQGGKLGLYFHDDRKVYHFKAVKWCELPVDVEDLNKIKKV